MQLHQSRARGAKRPIANHTYRLLNPTLAVDVEMNWAVHGLRYYDRYSPVLAVVFQE